ncbi:sensor histidine kinase [Cellulomonas endophytica]|uniref:sensor histidine kinase n=1 Tax=Cellulomonas endophytica TaxID=2494735 RepID=UPI00101042B3|nr:sensor domain-containing protein [Cellulomonas endophytica]
MSTPPSSPPRPLPPGAPPSTAPGGDGAGTAPAPAAAPATAAGTAAGTAPATRRAASTAGRLGQDTAYVATALPLALVSFTVLLVGLVLALGLLVTVLGLPVGAATLGAAVLLGDAERRRLELRGTPLGPLELAPVAGRGLRGVLQRLADPRRWAALLHGVGALVVALVTSPVLVAWWATALGGVTFWFWDRWLPQEPGTVTLVDLLDLPVTEAQLYALVGLVAALTLAPVTRACAALHAGWARLLLVGASRRALTARVAELGARGTSAAAAETQALRRLERDLHDGPQQRLVRLGMDLSVAERRLADDPDAARALLVEARRQTAETLAELRALSRGIAPPVLVDRGLEAAVVAVAGRCTVPVAVEAVLPDGRPAPAVEHAAYFVVCEALTNVAKHAGAATAAVRLGRTPAGRLRVEVHDDGVGGAAAAKGHGLAGLGDRVAGLGGTLEVRSPAGGPTVLVVELPWQV